MNSDKVWAFVNLAESRVESHNPAGDIIRRLTGLDYLEVKNDEREFRDLFPTFWEFGPPDEEKKRKYCWVKSQKIEENEYEGGECYWSHTYVSRFEVADKLLKILGDIEMMSELLTTKEDSV